jgi:hypothetical protein
MDAAADSIKGWLSEAKQDGETFLKQQRSWADIDKGVAIIAGDMQKSLKNMSDIHVPMVKRAVRETVATLANMRPLWAFKTDNDDQHKTETVLNKMLRAWYFNPFVRHSFRSSLQYATGCGLGWASPVWGTHPNGQADIVLDVYGPRGVVPYGMSPDNDIQKAYVVTLIRETPLQLAMQDWPLQLDKIVPNRGVASWMKKGQGRVQRFLSPLLNAFGPGSGKDRSDTNPFPTVDIYHSYILDASINQTGHVIKMGDPGTRWEYDVPVYGSQIDTGTKDEKGNPLYRLATAEDAKMYPLRRRIIWTDLGILKDNTSPWWHGKVPAIPFFTDDWPWDFIGYPMSRDGSSIEKSATRLLRALDDSANVKLDPPLAYDENAVSKGLMDRFNPRRTGQRIKINASQNEKPITMPVPAEFYSVDAWVAEMPSKLYEYMNTVLGTRDIQALAKAKQVPSGDSIEKLAELAGPLIMDMSANMEGSMVQLGEQWKGLAFEFYTMRRRVQVLGDDGVTEQDYDFDPGSMIPSHLSDEMAKIKEMMILAGKNGTKYDVPQSRASVVERGRETLQSFIFHVTPNSLHQITQITKKMMLMQLWKLQFPLDPWTLAEAMDIDNFGTAVQARKLVGIESAEQVPDDVFGRWILWKEIMNKLAPQPQHGQGRKPSGQTPPTMQGKEGGQRQTVRESPR